MKETRQLTDAQLSSIAEQLIGQCEKDIDHICAEDGLPLFDDWSVLDAAALDELAFRCSKCEWWVSGDDHAEVEEYDFVCSECGNE